MATKPKQVGYRLAKVGDGKWSLQQLLTQALAKCNLVRDRLQALDTAGTEFLVIGRTTDTNGFLCGTVVSFERGRYQIVIDDDEEAEELTLSAIQPPSPEGDNGPLKQYAPGLLYFAVFGNHVAVIQGVGVTTVQFEKYLAWLLRDKSGVMAPTDPIGLLQPPPPAAEALIRKNHVKSIRFWRPLVDGDGASSPETGQELRATKATPGVARWLKDILDDTMFADLGLDRDDLKADIEFFIQVRAKRHSRSYSPETLAILDQLAIATRNIEDENDVEVELVKGGTLKGGQLRVSGSLACNVSQGMFSDSEVFQLMTEWVKKHIESGAIGAE